MQKQTARFRNYSMPKSRLLQRWFNLTLIETYINAPNTGSLVCVLFLLFMILLGFIKLKNVGMLQNHADVFQLNVPDKFI